MDKLTYFCFWRLLEEGKWDNAKFVGLTDTSFPYTSGPTFKVDSVVKIFDVVWSNMSEQILTTTLLKETDQKWTLDDINTYLASILVMGLTSQPSVEDYFQQDSRGIFGSK